MMISSSGEECGEAVFKHLDQRPPRRTISRATSNARANCAYRKTMSACGCTHTRDAIPRAQGSGGRSVSHRWSPDGVTREEGKRFERIENGHEQEKGSEQGITLTHRISHTPQ
eukprot:2198220-Prymnesium_polylepis.2